MSFYHRAMQPKDMRVDWQTMKTLIRLLHENLTMSFYHRAVHPKDEGGLANNEDPDQTAP